MIKKKALSGASAAQTRSPEITEIPGDLSEVQLGYPYILSVMQIQKHKVFLQHSLLRSQMSDWRDDG